MVILQKYVMVLCTVLTIKLNILLIKRNKIIKKKLKVSIHTINSRIIGRDMFTVNKMCMYTVDL